MKALPQGKQLKILSLYNLVEITMKKLALAIALASTASAANAAWEYDKGEAILTIWNPENTRSVSVDLNTTFLQFRNDEVGNKTWTLSEQAKNFLLEGSDASKLKWNVAAYSKFAPTANTLEATKAAIQNTGSMTIMKDGEPANNPNFAWNFTGWDATGTKYKEYNLFLNRQDKGLSVEGDDEYFGQQNGFYAGSTWGDRQAGHLETKGFFKMVADNGESMAAKFISVSLEKNGGAAPIETKEYVFKLDAESRTFTYSAVPVPAAALLFGSALVGLVGISRRRTAA